MDKNTPIIDSGLSVRSRNALRLIGCKTVGDLSEFTYLQIKNAPNFGNKSMREVELLMEQVGIKYTDKPKETLSSRIEALARGHIPGTHDRT